MSAGVNLIVCSVTCERASLRRGESRVVVSVIVSRIGPPSLVDRSYQFVWIVARTF